MMSSKYRHLYQLCYVKIFSTNQYENLELFDDPGRVRSQITSVVCQIQRFDFDCNLVVTRKVITGIPPVLGRNSLYATLNCAAAMVAKVPCNLTPRHPPSQVLDDLPRYGF
jgi:hypothetical protein